jgi:hypothetical protein
MQGDSLIRITIEDEPGKIKKSWVNFLLAKENFNLKNENLMKIFPSLNN